MPAWFTGSESWFTLKPQVRGGFRRVNQDFCLISDFIASDLRFYAGSCAPPFRGRPLVNQASSLVGQGTENQASETIASHHLAEGRAALARPTRRSA